MNDIWSGSESPQNQPPVNGKPEREFRVVRESQWNELVGILKDHEVLLAALVRSAAELGRETTVKLRPRNARERLVRQIAP